MPDKLPFDPIQLWGAFGTVVFLLFLALIAWLREWVVLGSLYRASKEREKQLEADLETERAKTLREIEKREALTETKDDQMHKLRDSLEQKLNDSNRLLVEASEAFQRMRRGR